MINFKFRKLDFLINALMLLVFPVATMIPHDGDYEFKMINFAVILFTGFAVLHNFMHFVVHKSLTQLLLTCSFLSGLLITTPVYLNLNMGNEVIKQFIIQIGINSFRFCFFLAMLKYSNRKLSESTMRKFIVVLVVGFLPGKIIMIVVSAILFRATAIVLFEARKPGNMLLLVVFSIQNIGAVLEGMGVHGMFMIGFLILTFTVLLLNNIQLQTAINLAYLDPLTGLYNRLYVQNFVKSIKSSLMVVMIDIDKFKKINDTYGHLFGDEVLKQVSTILKNSVRCGDVVARWGGEEFLIMMKLDKDNYEILERIRKNVEDNPVLNTFVDPSCHVNITISIGSCIGSDFCTTIGNADKALYEAKETGRNRIVSV